MSPSQPKSDSKRSALSGVLGRNLLRFRRVRGWSLEELADKAGISRASIDYLESGAAKSLRLTTIDQLAAVFQIRPEDFLRAGNGLPDNLAPPAFTPERTMTALEFAEREREELTGHEYRLLQKLEGQTDVLRPASRDEWHRLIRILRDELPPRF